jgi:uncharacterized protein YjgD (DUF1641 family)
MKMSNTVELERRLERLESRLDRVLALLERSPVAPAPETPAGPATLASAARRAEASLGEVYGAAQTQDRLAELLICLGEPETVETLTRIAVLLPQLEYALQGVAAGPELMQEAMELMKSRLHSHTAEGAFEVRRRLDTVLELAYQLSSPEIARALGHLAKASVDLTPLVESTAHAIGDFSQTEGPEKVAARLSEAFFVLADEDTLGALTRIAALAPDLEYAVQAVAAGPVLLEEGMQLAKERLARLGLGTLDLDRRVEAAGTLLLALTDGQAARSLGELAGLLPLLAPAVKATAKATSQLAQVEGHEVLSERLAEAMMHLASPDVLDSFTRVALLLPDLEYAINALAAGPELLEEGMQTVRRWVEAQGGSGDLDARLKTVAATLYQLTDPKMLEALTATAKVMPVIQGAFETAAGVAHKIDVGGLMEVAALLSSKEGKRLIELAIQTEPAMAAVPRQAETLRILATMNQAVADASATPKEVGFFGLMSALREPEVQRAAGFGVEVARRLGRTLNGSALVPHR